MINQQIKYQTIAFILALLPAYAGAALYSIINLTPNLNQYDKSYAVGVNDTRQVVGYLLGGSPFIARNGTVTYLSPYFSPVGINSSGQVAGYSGLGSLIYSKGTIIPINNSWGGSFAYATGINDSGLVTGRAELTPGIARAFTSSGGPLQNLGTLPGGEQNSSAGYAVNKIGQVTGEAYFKAFITQNGVMRNLGTLGGTYSRGYAINDVGQVAGESLHTDGTVHAFVTRNQIMADLGRLGDWSSASGINNAGQVVGRYYLAQQASYRAFATINGVMTDLNTLIPVNAGWTLNHATDVNNLGWIVGYGINRNGYTRAFLLKPL